MGVDVWEDVEPPLECIIARIKNEEILRTSASGGVFTALAKAVIEQHGVVFGARFAEGKVSHSSAETEERIAAFRSSKYVQSDLSTSYSDVAAYLKKGRVVLFSGTPCQVAGLLSYLHVARVEEGLLERLYTVDFVCHGVGSPAAFKHYLDEREGGGDRVTRLNMRSKRYGYRNPYMELEYSNGRKRYASTKMDDYLGAFFSDFISRPCCYSCEFKSARHKSDLTLWDSWNAERILGIPFDDKGFTNVAIQTKRGKDLFARSQHLLDSFEVQFDKIRPKNGGMMLFPAQRKTGRGAFFRCMNAEGLGTAMAKYAPKSVSEKLTNAIKPALHSLRLLDMVSRLSRSFKRGR